MVDDPEGAATLTIRDVADACGLPQPAIAQLVPRTWTAQGWMYTPDQREEAIRIANALLEDEPVATGEDRGGIRLKKLLADPERAQRVDQIRQQMREDDLGDHP